MNLNKLGSCFWGCWTGLLSICIPKLLLLLLLIWGDGLFVPIPKKSKPNDWVGWIGCTTGWVVLLPPRNPPLRISNPPPIFWLATGCVDIGYNGWVWLGVSKENPPSRSPPPPIVFWTGGTGVVTYNPKKSNGSFVLTGWLFIIGFIIWGCCTCCWGTSSS